MKKIIFLLMILFPCHVFALNYPVLHYDKVIVYDVTDDEIRYEIDSDEKASIASLTKIMTTITALEEIDNLDEEVVYTRDMKSMVSSEASIAGLHVGDVITYRDLLYASILPSGADATIALAMQTVGSVEDFVVKMNEKAQKLGMLDTHFVNVTGLDEKDHYSTCRDLLILLRYALDNEIFKEIYTTKTYTLSNNLFVKSTLLFYRGDVSRIVGSKTGFTLDAGRCISVSFISNNHEYIMVSLGAPVSLKDVHIEDALEIISFIDENYYEQNIVEEGFVVESLPVRFSDIDSYDVVISASFFKYLEKDYDNSLVNIKYDGMEELSYKDEKGMKLGTLSYYYGDTLLKEEDVFLQRELPISLRKIIYFYRYVIFCVLCLSLFLFLLIFRIVRCRKSKV